MAVTPSTSSPEFRPNPFALPTNTSVRFALLVALVVVATLQGLNQFFLAVSGELMHQARDVLPCVNAVVPMAPTGSLDSAFAALQQFGEAHPVAFSRLMECFRPLIARTFLPALGGLGWVFGVAGFLYCYGPTWRIRWCCLTPLSAAAYPEVRQRLEKLCQAVALPSPPNFWLDLRHPPGEPLAFGRRRQASVVLPASMVTTLVHTDPEAFEALMLHELAHLKHADVPLAASTMALWWAFVLSLLGPYALFTLVTEPWTEVLSTHWRLVLLATLVYAARNAILRVRELHADALASSSEASRAVLGRVLDTLQPPDPTGPWPRLWCRLWRPVYALLHHHPEPTQRRQALAMPRALFSPSVWEAMSMGFVTSLGVFHLTLLLLYLYVLYVPFETLLTAASTDGFLRAVVGLCLVMPFLLAPWGFLAGVVSAMGREVWRATFAASLCEAPPPRCWRLALGLAGGVVGGPSLTSLLQIQYFRDGLGQLGVWDTAPAPLPLGLVVLWTLVWGGLLTLALWGVLRWVHTSAAVWLPVCLLRQSPRLLRGVCTVSMGFTWITLASWGMPFLYLYLVWVQALGLMNDAATLGGVLRFFAFAPLMIVLNPCTLPALFVLWGFPCAASGWRRRHLPEIQPSWVTLEPAALPRRSPAPVRERSGLALLVGVLGGVGGVGFFYTPLLDLYMQTVSSSAWYPAATAALSYLPGLVLIVPIWGMQMLVATLVSSLLQRLPVVHGLSAAFVAACLMTGGLFLRLGPPIEDAPLASMWTIASAIFVGGTGVALLAGGLSAWLSRWGRQARRG